MAHKVERGLIERDCMHLLYCVAHGECPPPQTYEKLAAQTNIPKRTVWDIINKYRPILKSVAYKYNYRVRFVHGEDIIIDAVYDGAIRTE